MGILGNLRDLLFFVLCTESCRAIDIVRLVNSSGKETHSTKGVVEFFFDGQWGEICYNDFSKEDGGVLCRHLNFLGVKGTQIDNSQRLGNKHRHKIEISCLGHEENLHNCHHSRIFENSVYRCKTSSLHISCYDYSHFSVDNSTVRLDGGDGSYGRVEYMPDGLKTICGENWGEFEGGVVCRELGFRGVKSLKLSPWPKYKDASSAKFKCNGSEISLTECQTNKVDFDNFYSFSSSYESSDETFKHCSESIEVTCLRDIDFISPNFTRIHEKQAGESFNLKCNATNSTKVWWRRRNWRDDVIVENNTVLHLQIISHYDLGRYTCVVEGLRGQQIESNASQTLIILNYAQILLQTTGEASTEANLAKIRSNCETQFKFAGYDVFSKSGESGGFIMQLGKLYKTGNTPSYTAITNEIDGILDDIRENTSAKSDKLHLLKQGLSFCIGEPQETVGAGILHFPSTRINSRADSVELCVGSNTSRATRECVGDLITVAVWKDADLRNCFNITDNPTVNTKVLIQTFFEEVEATNLTIHNVSAISRDLADATAIADVTKDAINDIKVVLEKITNVESAEPSVTRNVIETVDNVVNQSSGIDETLTPQASSIILQSFEKQLDTVKQSGSNFTHKRPNIEVQVIQIEDKESPIKFEFFKSENDSQTKLNRNETDQDLEEDFQVAVEIPSTILKNLAESCSVAKNGTQGSLPVSFTIFLNGALFNDSTTDKERNSLIVSTSMLCDVSSLPNGNSVSTLFSPKNDSGEHPWECVFWKPSTDGHENETGVWSSEGCVDCGGNSKKANEDPMDVYNCSWTHLTNFAVLLDIKGDTGSQVLDVITVIGCVISIIALLITISSYLFMKKLRSSQPKQIIIMLCSSLLGLYLTFMIGIDRTESKASCVIFGGLIHFFCLSTVAWMSIEATQLYLLLVKVVNAHVRHFMTKASAIAWGIPFFVVVVCVAAANDAYSHAYCFPAHYSNVFYFGVLGLVAFLLIYNIVTYTMIVRSISAPRKNIISSQSDRAGRIRRLQNALAISVLLGLSWVFGFLALGSLRMVFNVLFCLFNSFQGFFIFLLFCLRQEEIRVAWREWFGIAICLKTDYDTTTVSEKPTTSTSRHLTRESEVSKSFSKSQGVELTDLKSIDEATVTTPESLDIATPN